MRVRSQRPTVRIITAMLLAALLGAPAALATTGDPVPIPPGEILPINLCGTLRNDVDDGCWYFETHNGGVYTIEFTGSFGHGDRVCVLGQAVSTADCVLSCAGAAIGCIINNSISAGFVGPGTVQFGAQICPRLVADSGGSYELDNLGAFGSGSRVFVTGRLQALSDICPTVEEPAIVNNTIEPYFEGCATVAPGPQGCMTLVAEDESYYVIGDLGGAGLGDEVDVAGVVIPESSVCAPAVGPALIVMGTGACEPFPDVPGDVNGDGQVNFGDILVVVGQWGTCVNLCPADVNNDGGVNFSDILFILAHWSG